MSAGLTIGDIHSLKRNEALEILDRISRVERKTFPTNAAFGFGEDLWRKSPTRGFCTRLVPMKEADPISSPTPCMCGQKGVALAHKVCMVEVYRRQGVGQQLTSYIQERLRKEGCQYVQLWVDQARVPARVLYARNGFEEREVVPDYYAPGWTGIRMVLDLERVPVG